MANYVTNTSDKEKSKALIKCIIGGWFGLHLFYVGRIGRGLLFMSTGGLLGFGWISDIISIQNGSFRDNVGAPLRE